MCFAWLSINLSIIICPDSTWFSPFCLHTFWDATTITLKQCLIKWIYSKDFQMYSGITICWWIWAGAVIGIKTHSQTVLILLIICHSENLVNITRCFERIPKDRIAAWMVNVSDFCKYTSFRNGVGRRYFGEHFITSIYHNQSCFSFSLSMISWMLKKLPLWLLPPTEQ